MSSLRLPNLSHDPKLPHLIVITGPTASGKSSLALETAERLGAHIISAESRQIYRGIPITTAAPSPDDLRRVPHHLVEFLDLDAYYSAASFAADADGIIRRAAQLSQPYVVVCGGSMMYVDALLYGLDNLPTITPEVRLRVADLYRQTGLEGLLAFLSNLDPQYADTVAPDNPRRVMHAVELCLQAGKPVSQILSRTPGPLRYSYTKFVIDLPRHELFRRIDTRVDAMVAAGMEAEARSLYHLRHLNSLNTIGFKEWFACFDGTLDRPTAIARIAKNTRVYAKKQLTWLARQSDVVRLQPQNALQNLLNHISAK